MRRHANPEMILLARQSRGVTQAQLAEKASISPGYLSRIEHGDAPPAEEHLTRIAESLNYPVSLLYRSEHVRGTDSVCFHHRKRKSMPAKLLTRIEAEMHLTQLQIKRLLDDVDVDTDREFLTLDPDEHGGPEGVAQVLRAFWHLPSGPITNLVRVMESAGAVVVLRDFGTFKLDGMSCWAKGSPPLFFINSAFPTDRRRWTIAHELGHLLMHSSPTSENPEEEANAFAREFLIPEAEIKSDLRRLTFRQLPMLKSYWRVSMIALVKAAADTHALPPNKIKSLYVQISRNGWRTEEPYDLPEESPTVVRDALAVHVHDHDYTAEELAARVNLHPSEFREIYTPDERRLRAVN